MSTFGPLALIALSPPNLHKVSKSLVWIRSSSCEILLLSRMLWLCLACSRMFRQFCDYSRHAFLNFRMDLKMSFTNWCICHYCRLSLYTARNDEISPHFFGGKFRETDTFPIIYQRGHGNFRFSEISHRNLSIFLRFLSKNYEEILIFFAVITRVKRPFKRGSSL